MVNRLTGDSASNKIDTFFEKFKGMYHGQSFPEGKTYHDGTVFNELELYRRKSDNDKAEHREDDKSHNEESVENALANLSLDSIDK